jgi:hypothetical protein
MILRRIFSGLILALLLSASSLGAACDLSCAFASMNSDCHSARADGESSKSGGMNMAGMDMAAGMTMPQMGGSQDQQGIPAISETSPLHASIGEMGPCEKQACDGSSAIFARMNGSSDSQFHLIPAVARTPRVVHARTLFRGARDNVANDPLREETPLRLSLRI